jgi:hypothetical protein
MNVLSALQPTVGLADVLVFNIRQLVAKAN